VRPHRPPKYNKYTIYIYIEDFILAIFWSNTMQIVAQIYQRRENLRFRLRPKYTKPKYTQIYKRPKYTSLTLALPPSPRSSDRRPLHFWFRPGDRGSSARQSPPRHPLGGGASVGGAWPSALPPCRPPAPLAAAAVAGGSRVQA